MSTLTDQPKSNRLHHAGSGFVLGMLSWIAATQLGLGDLPGLRIIGGSSFGIILVGVVIAAVMTTRARTGIWAASFLLCALLLLVSGTPLSMVAVRGLIRSDPLQRADAVYVLGTGIMSDGTFPHTFQDRILHAYEVLQKGYAPRFVVPRLNPPHRSYLPEARRQMKLFGITASIEEISPVSTTYDEAMAVAKLARERGWKRVILVTSPAHSRRTAAVFSKAGVTLVSSPCTEGGYDIHSNETASGRMAAFRDWAREYVAYQIYRLRGQI